MKNNGVWVYLIGIFMFVWGFCQLGYAIKGFDLPITIPFTEWGKYFGENDLFEDMQLGLSIACIVSGMGMLIFQAWARVVAVWITWTISGFFFYIFLMVGPLEFEEFFIRMFAIVFTMVLILLWFFNQEATRETLNSDPMKKQKRLIPFSTMLLMVTGIFVFINLPSALPIIYSEAQFPEIKEVNYPSKSRHYYANKYEHTEFPLPYTIAIPKGSTLISLNQSSGFNNTGQCEIRLDTPGQAQSLILKSETAIQKEWSSDKIQKFFNNIHPLTPYNYARKIYSDRRSIANWKSREINQGGGDEIHEVHIKGLRSFVVKAENTGEVFGKDIRWYYDFSLYRKDKSAGGGYLFAFKGHERNLINIFASLEPKWDKSKTALDFYEEGKTRVKRKKYEKAKMSFASAVCLEENNPEHHHALGEVFFKTKSYEQADRHLTKAMKLFGELPDSEFDKTRELFEKTRKKLGKSTELKSGEEI